MDDPKPPRKKHRLLKWITGFLFILLLVLVTAAWYLNNHWKPLLTNVIKNSLIDATDSLYHVNFYDIDVNILTGGVTIDSITVKPDLRIYKKLIAKGLAPENLINLKVTRLSLKNVNPLKIYRERKLDMSAIVLETPELSVFYTKLKNQIRKPKDVRTPYQRIKNILNELKIASLFLSDVKFKYVDQSLAKPKTTLIEKVNIRLNNILINKNSQFDNNRIFTAKDVIAEIDDYDFATPDSMYHINIKHLAISTLKKEVVAAGVGLIPRYSEMKFTDEFDYQKERYKILFDTVMASNINFDDLLNRRSINTSTVKIMDGELAVFLNREKPIHNIDKSKNYPHLALQRVAWNIIADTVIIKNLNVSYTEYNPKTNAKGTVFFNDLNGRIFNVTNDSATLAKKHFADAYVETYLMGKGKLDVHIGFNLTDPNGAFTYSGSLGSMQTASINSLTKPLAMVMTSSGKINSMNFDMKGDTKSAGGTLTLNYEDLNVVLMKKDEKENFKKLGLISLFANALLLDRSNPTNNKPIRVAHPYYIRPSNASFFNLMWKAIFDGVKESVGITKEKEAKLMRKAASFKDFKLQREQRKLERQQRRAKRKNK